MSPNPELHDGVPPSPNILPPAAPSLKFKSSVPVPFHNIQVPVVTEAVATLAASALKVSSYYSSRRRTMSSTNSIDGDFDHHDKTVSYLR